MSNTTVLGIETSCDDTSICLLNGDREKLDVTPVVLSHLNFSSEKILSRWGGVVPEIAARNHLEKITPLLDETFKDTPISPGEIDYIGVTTHPGLLGPLLIGLNAAKTLSLLFKIPIVSVNHLYAHLEAIHLTESVNYPYLGLLISGGHSIYFLTQSPKEFTIIGSTIDDAAGEAFDKGAKLMGLGYPGGRIIDQLASTGDAERFKFPIGLINSKNASLSFSGVKTSLRHFLEKNPEHKENNQSMKDICASYQKAIIDALELKLKYALKEACEITDKKQLPIIVGGGVACNSSLRSRLHDRFNNVYFVKPEFCTDNGAMVANFALRNSSQAIQYPESLSLDATSRFIRRGVRHDPS